MISVLIPLYRSKRWLPVIERNIEEALSIGAEVILSDRHGSDDALHCLKRSFDGAPHMVFLEERDGGDFVENTNALIRRSTREYFRIIPHDDDASAAGTLRLVDALRADPCAILAYGGVEGIDADGNRLPRADTLHEHEPAVPENWTLSDVLPIFWTNRFNGAFKALIRKSAIDENALFMRKGGTVWYCERAWLFGLGLKGRFCRAPGVVLQKRYYQQSTHRQWRRTREVNYGGAAVLASYARDFIEDEALRSLAIRDIYRNADIWAAHENPAVNDPGYTPLEAPERDTLDKASLLPPRAFMRNEDARRGSLRGALKKALGHAAIFPLRGVQTIMRGRFAAAAVEKVTICIPTWQAEGFISNAIDCAARQTHENLAILISVDACDDQTANVCRRRAQSDPRIRVLEQSGRLGWTGNINSMLRAVETDYYAIFFHDDLIHPDWIKVLLSALRERPDAGAAFCNIKEGRHQRPGENHDGDAFRRLMTRLVSPLQGAPLRALTRQSALSRPVRFPPVSQMGFEAQHAYLFDLIAQAPMIYAPRTLYFRRNMRKGGVTHQWRTMAVSEIRRDLGATACAMQSTIDRAISDSQQRAILKECARLVLLLHSVQFEARNGMHLSLRPQDLITHSTNDNIDAIVRDRCPEHAENLGRLRGNLESARRKRDEVLGAA